MTRTVFPAQGTWFYINNLLNVAEVIEYLLENYTEKKITVLIICGKDFKKKVIRRESRIKWLQAFMKNNCGTGRLKIRVTEEDT